MRYDAWHIEYMKLDKQKLSRWLSGKKPACKCRRHGFDPWVEKIPWRREKLPTPVFWPGEFQRVRHN